MTDKDEYYYDDLKRWYPMVDPAKFKTRIFDFCRDRGATGRYCGSFKRLGIETVGDYLAWHHNLSSSDTVKVSGMSNGTRASINHEVRKYTGLDRLDKNTYKSGLSTYPDIAKHFREEAKKVYNA